MKPFYYIFQTKALANDKIQIIATEKLTKKTHGYVQMSTSPWLEHKMLLEMLLEIEQLFVDVSARRTGLGGMLASKAIKYAINMNKGIHMMIQPGSERFWRKYFNTRFDGKRMTLFGGEILNSKLMNGKVFQIVKESLIQHYRFPQDEHRDLEMEKICTINMI